MSIVFSAVSLLIILFLIVFACIIFTNAIEHLGERLNLSEGAVGSVLAAVGTALPETIVPLVAILGSLIVGGNAETSNEIGIGAILGAPFLLGTLAFFVTGVAVYYYSRKGKRTLDMPINTSVMKRDIRYFMITYFIAISASFIPNYPIKIIIAIVLLGLYAFYVYLTVNDSSKTGGSSECNSIEPLYFSRFFNDSMAIVIIQTIISILGIILLAHFFVKNLEIISSTLNIPPLVLSLIITPIATELPEKFNSVIWIKCCKDTLSLGNITGAMVFQSCIPTSVGILLTPWILAPEGFMSVILVYISVIIVYINIKLTNNILKPWTLLLGGISYLVYIGYLLYYILPNK